MYDKFYHVINNAWTNVKAIKPYQLIISREINESKTSKNNNGLRFHKTQIKKPCRPIIVRVYESLGFNKQHKSYSNRREITIICVSMSSGAGKINNVIQMALEENQLEKQKLLPQT